MNQRQTTSSHGFSSSVQPETSSPSSQGSDEQSARLQDQLELYRLLSRGKHEIILFLDSQGRILEANSAAVAAYGYGHDSLLGLSIGDLDVKTSSSPYSLAASEAAPYETVHRRKDGGSFPVEIFNERIGLDGASISIALVRDITERKRSQERLVAEAQRYRVVADNTYDWELWLDPKGRVIYSSPSCERITGYTAAQITADPTLVSRMVCSEHRPAFDAHQKTVLRGAAPSHDEIAYRINFQGEGERWIGHVCTAIHDEAGKFIGVRASNRDITERKRIEAEHQMLSKQVEEKNAELEKFTYSVSHDLKSPLITIKGFLGLAEQDVDQENRARFKTDMARIGRAADKMGQLLDDLLQLSRIGRIFHPPEEVPLATLVHETLDLLAGPLSKKKVSVSISPSLPTVVVDRPRFLQVLENLISNAVRFMGDQPAPRIEVGSRQEGDQTICFVRDNGIGIDPRYHEKVFGLFETLDQKSGGTGIGLAIVKRIVENHGGRVWVESEGPGKGSCFCFTVPAKKRAENEVVK